MPVSPGLLDREVSGRAPVELVVEPDTGGEGEAFGGDAGVEAALPVWSATSFAAESAASTPLPRRSSILALPIDTPAPPSARPRAPASTGAAVTSRSTRLPALVRTIDDLSLGATKQRDDPKPKRRKPVRLAVANVMSARRDKYMIGAYAVAGARMAGRWTSAE